MAVVKFLLIIYKSLLRGARCREHFGQFPKENAACILSHRLQMNGE